MKPHAAIGHGAREKADFAELSPFAKGPGIGHGASIATEVDKIIRWGRVGASGVSWGEQEGF